MSLGSAANEKRRLKECQNASQLRFAHIFHLQFFRQEQDILSTGWNLDEWEQFQNCSLEDKLNSRKLNCIQPVGAFSWRVQLLLHRQVDSLLIEWKRRRYFAIKKSDLGERSSTLPEHLNKLFLFLPLVPRGIIDDAKRMLHPVGKSNLVAHQIWNSIFLMQVFNVTLWTFWCREEDEYESQGKMRRKLYLPARIFYREEILHIFKRIPPKLKANNPLQHHNDNTHLSDLWDELWWLRMKPTVMMNKLFIINIHIFWLLQYWVQEKDLDERIRPSYEEAERCAALTNDFGRLMFNSSYGLNESIVRL